MRRQNGFVIVAAGWLAIWNVCVWTGELVVPKLQERMAARRLHKEMVIERVHQSILHIKRQRAEVGHPEQNGALINLLDAREIKA